MDTHRRKKLETLDFLEKQLKRHEFIEKQKEEQYGDSNFKMNKNQ